ncbi:MAG: hypothetical protein U9Q85_00715 [Patescibacteria group bacterium]|nr:hypothetical protein [Patescibacteria group bacterium]
MKKILTIILFFVFILSACGQKQAVPMDQLSEDGKYHYKNEQLGFWINFPEEFIYYQTQSNNLGNYIDMEYFVPTGDREYPQTVKSYARAVMIRVIDKTDYDDALAEDTSVIGFEKIAETSNRLYFIDFWNTVPKDWIDKWSEGMRQEIEKSFKN